MFNWVSREKRIQIIDPKIDSPPVGYYSPNYSLFDYKRGSDLRFGKTKIKGEDSIISNSPKKSHQKFETIKGSNRPDEIRNEFDKIVRTPRYLQSVNNAIQRNKYGNQEENIGKVLLKSLSPNK